MSGRATPASRTASAHERPQEADEEIATRWAELERRAGDAIINPDDDLAWEAFLAAHGVGGSGE